MTTPPKLHSLSHSPSTIQFSGGPEIWDSLTSTDSTLPSTEAHSSWSKDSSELVSEPSALSNKKIKLEMAPPSWSISMASMFSWREETTSHLICSCPELTRTLLSTTRLFRTPSTETIIWSEYGEVVSLSMMFSMTFVMSKDCWFGTTSCSLVPCIQVVVICMTVFTMKQLTTSEDWETIPQ